VSKPPKTPYPPDPDDDAPAATELGDLTDAVAENVDWANGRAPRSAWRRVEIRRARLTGTELGEASFADVLFDECRLDLAGLRFAKLERIVFRDCVMNECDLHGAKLKDVLFERCVLRDATFSSATVERVELRGCNLVGVGGIEALRGARMPWNDVLEAAPLFAGALGIEIVD
jgi:uncharacterized protein YjbI with pentapeptide repeats